MIEIEGKQLGCPAMGLTAASYFRSTIASLAAGCGADGVVSQVSCQRSCGIAAQTGTSIASASGETKSGVAAGDSGTDNGNTQA